MRLPRFRVGYLGLRCGGLTAFFFRMRARDSGPDRFAFQRRRGQRVVQQGIRAGALLVRCAGVADGRRRVGEDTGGDGHAWDAGGYRRARVVSRLSGRALRYWCARSCSLRGGDRAYITLNARP